MCRKHKTKSGVLIHKAKRCKIVFFYTFIIHLYCIRQCSKNRIELYGSDNVQK